MVHYYAHVWSVWKITFWASPDPPTHAFSESVSLEGQLGGAHVWSVLKMALRTFPDPPTYIFSESMFLEEQFEGDHVPVPMYGKY